MITCEWYFDFVSPFSYFALRHLDALNTKVELRYRPVLLAELLRHSGGKGPAEIPSKRTTMYRWCVWHAQEQGVPFRFPAVHPFNPLPYLRLAVAANNSPQVIQQIFAALWTTGVNPMDEAVLQKIARDVNIDLHHIAEPMVKDALRVQTEQAVARGIFGVPTLVVNDEIFWGADAMSFARAYIDDSAILQTEEMQRVVTLPIGAVRKIS